MTPRMISGDPLKGRGEITRRAERGAMDCAVKALHLTLPGKTIWVRGTNGKSSTATYLARYLSREKKTLLYTSPHLLSPVERIQVNGIPIPLEALEGLERRLVEKEERGIIPRLTWFEAMTIHAATWACQQDVSYSVWEAGLGGPLDATSSFPADLSLLTPIGIDHTLELGETLAQIAHSKSADLEGIPTLSGWQPPEVLSTLTDVAWAPEVRSSPRLFTPQERNLALARFAARTLGVRDLSPPPRGVLGRFQLIRDHPPLLLDGAHNGEGIELLADAFLSQYRSPDRLLVGMGKGRLTPAVLAALHRLQPKEVGWCDLPYPWTSASATPLNTDWCGELPEALNWLMDAQGPSLATGSLYLIGGLLRALEGHSNAKG
ncbi:hypothetical protein H8D30_05715 [bacterium]|nr:hypothetical protein [bacterium]